MPSLIRLLTTVAIIGAIVYGVMIALVNFVEPEPREMSATIPSQRLNK